MEVVAERAGPGGATVLRTLRTQGQALAVRRTGASTGGPDGQGRAGGGARVHLVGTAAGPVGGDEVEVRVVVGAGACLEVAGVAATVVLPGRTQPRSQLLLDVDVADGGRLVCALPPVVVTGRAALAATTRVRLAGEARLRLVEHVRLGRHDETGGWWRGRTDVVRDGRAVLRQTTTLGEDPDDGLRDLRSVLDTAAAPTPGTAGDPGTVVLDLAAGGTLTVTLGRAGAAGRTP